MPSISSPPLTVALKLHARADPRRLSCGIVSRAYVDALIRIVKLPVTGTGLKG